MVAVGVNVGVSVEVKLGVIVGRGIGVSVEGGNGVAVFEDGLIVARGVEVNWFPAVTVPGKPQAARNNMKQAKIAENFHTFDQLI